MTAAGSAETFGQTPEGEPAHIYTLRSDRLRVRITDYGGRMVSVEAPDRDGALVDVLLGFDDAATYGRSGGAFGALLGRNANRLAGGRFAIDGTDYQADTNENGNTLHGGPRGFDKQSWSVKRTSTDELVLLLLSPDGDQGFPGELSVEARYQIRDASLVLTFQAITSKPTVVSLSAHPYFNLAGAAHGDILDHELTIAADAYLPTDAAQIPTGETAPVGGTPFDFREPSPIEARIRKAHPQLLHGIGYDQCFVLRGNGMRLAARARDPRSGRVLEVHTTQPSMQLYTGNKLNGSVVGRGGVIYRQSAGFALEPQGFPDAPNHPEFPSTVLRPGEPYQQVIEYRFATDR